MARLLESHSSWLQPARHLGRPAMLKLLKDTSDEQAGADVLRYFAGNGAVRLIAADHGGVLMERADDDVSLRMMAISGGDDRAAGILAGCVCRLHAPRECAAPDGLTPLRDWFRSLFAQRGGTADPCDGVPMSLAVCWQSGARSPCCTAICITTTSFTVRVAGLPSIPKGCSASAATKWRTCSATHGRMARSCTTTDRMLRLSTLYASRLDLDPRRVLGFALAHAGLSASWSLDDGGDPSYRLTCAALLDPLVT